MNAFATVLLAGITAVTMNPGTAGFDLADLFRSEGQVLNICCFDLDLVPLMEEYYPGYASDAESWQEEDGMLTGRGSIGETEVRWVVIPDSRQYTDYLDERLIGRDSLSPDERVDIFMTDADSATKYCSAGADVALTMEDLGIADGTTSQYRFTRQLVSDEDGFQRAVSWNVPCGAFVYRKSAAEAVWGTSEPELIELKVAAWPILQNTAAELRKGGYRLFAGPDAAYYPLIGKSIPWVDAEGTITIDDNAVRWVREMTEARDAGYIGNLETGTLPWIETLGKNSDVFGYFMTSEEAAEYIGRDAPADSAGDFRVCRGPSSYMNGGRWLCAAAGTDNRNLAADILWTFTCDSEVMTRMSLETGMITNNSAAMDQIRTDLSYGNPLFGGQNDIAVYAAAAAACDAEDLTYYDRVLSEIFLEAYRPYFSGEIEEEEALNAFYRNAVERYPYLNER